MTRKTWWQLGAISLALLILGYVLGASWQPWHPFKVNIWGTVGQWTSTILSAATVIFALYIILRDRRKADEDQARQMVTWLDAITVDDDNDTYSVEVHILNASRLTFFNVFAVVTITDRKSHRDFWKKIKANGGPDWMSAIQEDIAKNHVDPDTGEQEYYAFTDVENTRVIAPDQTGSCEIVLGGPVAFYDFDVVFRDAHGRQWMVDPSSSDLQRWEADYKKFEDLPLEEALRGPERLLPKPRPDRKTIRDSTEN